MVLRPSTGVTSITGAEPHTGLFFIEGLRPFEPQATLRSPKCQENKNMDSAGFEPAAFTGLRTEGLRPFEPQATLRSHKCQENKNMDSAGFEPAAFTLRT
jgi:hypothetical protein